MVQLNQVTQPTQDEVDALKKDISDFVEWHMKHGPHPASVVALQELTRLILPHAPVATRSVFTRNLTQPVIPINDILDWQMQSAATNQGADQPSIQSDLERGERAIRCRLATLYRLAGRFGLFALPNGTFTATARVGGTPGKHEEQSAQQIGSIRFLVAPCGILPHEVTAGAFAKVEELFVHHDFDNEGAHSSELRAIADGNTSMHVPRMTAAFHAAFYRAGVNVRVVCEVRTTQSRAIAATRRGLAVTAESVHLGKIEYLEYDEIVPEAMRLTAQGVAQAELSKQLRNLNEQQESAEAEFSVLRGRLDALVAQRDEAASKVRVKKTKQPKHAAEKVEVVAQEGEEEKKPVDEEHIEADKQQEGTEEEGEAKADVEPEKTGEAEADAEPEKTGEAEADAEPEKTGEAEEHGDREVPQPEPDVEKPAEKEPEIESESEYEEDEEAARHLAELDAEIESIREKLAELEALVNEKREQKTSFVAGFDAALQRETRRLHAERYQLLVNRLEKSFENSASLRVFFVRSFGAIVCAGSVEQSLFAARTLQSACVTTLSLGKLSRGGETCEVDGPPIEEELITIRAESDGEEMRIRPYELEFEVLARELDASGALTGYSYRLPGLRAAQRTERRPAELSEIEIPPVPQYLSSADELDYDGEPIPAASKPARVEYRVTPSVYRREEKEVPGSARKLIRWVSERGSDRSANSTVYRVDAPHAAFAPPGDVRSMIANRARVRDAYYNDTVSAGPQSRFESEAEWDEAARRKDAVLSGRVDSTLVVGAASRGVLNKDALASGTAATVYYAPNPFQQPAATNRELRRYLKSQHVHLPNDASGFLEERPDEEAEAEEAADERYATPKRRASISGGLPATPVPVGLNSVAVAAAQRAAELSEKRLQSSQPEASSPVTPAPAPQPTLAQPPVQPQAVSPQQATTQPKVQPTTGTVQVGVAASASEPVQLTIASGSKSKTLPAGVTQAQVEAAGAEEKKKKGLKKLFSKKEKKK